MEKSMIEKIKSNVAKVYEANKRSFEQFSKMSNLGLDKMFCEEIPALINQIEIEMARADSLENRYLIALNNCKNLKVCLDRLKVERDELKERLKEAEALVCTNVDCQQQGQFRKERYVNRNN